MKIEDFLLQNRIEQATWQRAKIDWQLLQDIANDHNENSAQLTESAALFSKVIQKFKDVHSVRWRVKDSSHLMEKIVRKRAEGIDKYLSINLDNYFDVVTDLIGIRAIHLFKDDCFSIDAELKKLWSPLETPVAYIRDGDQNELTDRLKAGGFDIKIHPAGYRSVHYVIASQPLNRRVTSEIQVRTIFEEGWSEIDHSVRYPNFSDNQLVGYFLAIFNRSAGSADEMGGFVRGLSAHLDGLQDEIRRSKTEKEKTVEDMEAALSQLENVTQQHAASQEHIATLKSEVAKLKKTRGALEFAFNSPVSEMTGIDNTIAKFLESQKDAASALRALGLVSGKRPIEKS